MTVERGLRLMAGIVVLLSLALAHWVNAQWIWLTVFAGANLLQSAITNWCPAVWILQKLGLPRETVAPSRREVERSTGR
ncbi:MAG: DUF2892 domain-containing protein [Deltaproteobacteria bacterium]|nr:DUF2892 domain-containing protein [Deltaproteobacteria bacterium]